MAGAATVRVILELITNIHFSFFQFLPRCMACRRSLAMRILSVRLSK